MTGVGLVTSDAHSGLITAIGATLPGATWQRCNDVGGELAQIAEHQRLEAGGRQVGAGDGSHGVPWDNASTRSAVPPAEGGWQPLAPSAVPFAGLAVPSGMSTADGTRLLADLERAARGAHRAGYRLLELHGANGYLFHEFLSPLANHRTDEWGGDLRSRTRFPWRWCGPCVQGGRRTSRWSSGRLPRTCWTAGSPPTT